MQKTRIHSAYSKVRVRYQNPSELEKAVKELRGIADFLQECVETEEWPDENMTFIMTTDEPDEDEGNEKRSSSYWYRRQETKILDPDGWRDKDAPDWCTPITQEEFNRRLVKCTVTHMADDNFVDGFLGITCGDEDDG